MDRESVGILLNSYARRACEWKNAAILFFIIIIVLVVYIIWKQNKDLDKKQVE